MLRDAYDTIYDYLFDAFHLLKRLGWKLYTGAVVIGLLTGLALALWPDKPPIPGPIKNQVTSTLFAPKGGGVSVDRQSAKYDAQNKLLSYTATYKGDALTLSEQPAPDQFGDINGYYSQFAQGLHTYSDFDTAQGHVYLIRPAGGTSQAAVLYGSGTLMFAKPATNLSDDAWKQFFRTISVIK